MIKTYVTIERRNSKGDILEKRTQESHSWLKHFFDLWYPQLGGGSLSAIYDITATPHNLVNSGEANLIVGSPPGYSSFFLPGGGFYNNDGPCHLIGQNVGIVIGTDNTAVTPQDNALAAKIPHGEETGEILYGGTELFGLSFANPNGSMNIRRYFTNMLGGNLSVAECGIYSPGLESNYPRHYGYYYCICRDVVSPAVVVANGEILSVVYTVTITV